MGDLIHPTGGRGWVSKRVMGKMEGRHFSQIHQVQYLTFTIYCIIFDIESTIFLHPHLSLASIRKSFVDISSKDSTSLTTYCCRCYTCDNFALPRNW